MAGKSATQREVTLDFWLRGVAPSADSSLWLALYTTPPNKDGGGVEVSVGSYVPQEIIVTSASWDDTTGTRTNANDITFPQATANWGTIVACALWNNVALRTASHLRYWGLLNRPVAINLGDRRKFPAGALVIIET